MWSNYEKFTIDMERKHEGFRLWKNGHDEAFCVLETYKDKRSIFMSAANLIPSSELYGKRRGNYHVVLLGIENGDLLHKDFGTFHVGQNGEGTFFQKFGGSLLSCYTHCLLVADYERDGEPEVIYQGKTPFFLEKGVPTFWEKTVEWCETQDYIEVFSSDIDETGAQWYRIPSEMKLPEPLAVGKPLIDRYRHYILGKGQENYFVGIPGRFLRREQPCREAGLFLLWQPLRGGEKFFDRVEDMTERQQEEIFGYWIAGIDCMTGGLKPL